MAHVRTAIRTAIVAALGGLSTTGSNVFPGRVHAVPADKLPALLVYSEGEDVQISGMGVARTQLRDLDLVVEAVFKDNAYLDAKADVILKEVEVALGPSANLGGGKYAQLTRVEIERGDSDKDAARMSITFQILYYTAHGAPESAL